MGIMTMYVAKTENIQNIIDSAIYNKRDTYKKLRTYERTELVAELLVEDEQIPLVEADHDKSLTKAIAETILQNGHKESLHKLYKVIVRLFVTGSGQEEAYYVEKIQHLLGEEWMAQNTGPNEHFQNDCMQRARDASSAMRSRNESPY